MKKKRKTTPKAKKTARKRVAKAKSKALRAAIARARAIARQVAAAERKLARLAPKLREAQGKVAALRDNNGPEARLLAAVAKGSRKMGMATAWTVRKALRMKRDEFDRVALALLREGRLVMHHHDHPSSLGESERLGCVWAGKTCYHAMAVRK